MSEDQLILIRTLEDLDTLKAYIADKDILAWDTETTGLDKDAEIVGFSVCCEFGMAFYVITSIWNKEKQILEYTECKGHEAKFFELLKEKRLVAHNATFDVSQVENNYKVPLIDSIFCDVMVMAHLLDEKRPKGLKDLAVAIFGDDVKAEQRAMKASVKANGGVWQDGPKGIKEMFKADPDVLGYYGAKDALLTFSLFYHFIPQLEEQGLWDFFFNECMPLLRGPTYDLNTVGLKVDTDKLETLKKTLEVECMELMAFIHKEISPYVSEKYPGTKKSKTFNINAGQQLSWLLFERLGNLFNTLTDSGKELCTFFNLKVPYSNKAKLEFIQTCRQNFGVEWKSESINPKTGKVVKAKKVGHFWTYLSADEDTISKFRDKYLWVKKLLAYSKSKKILNTYVKGIQKRMRYGIIHPSFNQCGTTSGRYSSSDPNFQNLPKSDKRIKACIVSRPGKVFVGSDYSQLEPRVFASVSQDPTLLSCFAEGKDFYSVVGIPIFGKYDSTPYKEGDQSFAVKYPKLRDISKAFALATPYGTGAFRQSKDLGLPVEECEGIIERYFSAYPKVELMMLESHLIAKRDGVVYSLFGRPRRIPEAKEIDSIYGKNTPHGELPYSVRSLLNLGMNHRVQSSGASIMNRAAIVFHKRCKELEKVDPDWLQVKIVLQVHDQLVSEGPTRLADQMAQELRHSMEETTVLPGVKLIAKPVISTSLDKQ